MRSIFPANTQSLAFRRVIKPVRDLAQGHSYPETHEPGDMLDPGICWQAIYSRDPRFDGRFFAGATTTGLYCRNVCAVPFARPHNVLLFPCAAAAESAGFRPCKRCQPQATPGTPAWLGTQAVVSRAIRLILEGALNEGSIEQLATRLGLGSRQLRRLFVQHLGVSPLKIATTHRVRQARKLIDESKLPMTQIAFRSGFGSIREFNHAIRNSTGLSPSELRRTAGSPLRLTGAIGLELRLPYREPFDWASLIAILKHRAIPGVELVSEACYRRTIEVLGAPGVLSVRPEGAASRLVVQVESSNCDGLAQTVERVRRIFDLNANPRQIGRHLSRDPMLQDLLRQRPGLRVPGVWDGFEAAVLAVLGQGLSGPEHRCLVERLVETFGISVDSGVDRLPYLFPRPEALAVVDLSRAGIEGDSAKMIRTIASATLAGNLNWNGLGTLEQAVAELRSVCALDESMAHRIAMHTLGDPDAFPTDDIGIRSRLAGGGQPCSPAEALVAAEPWRPWRAYAALHLACLSEAGSREE